MVAEADLNGRSLRFHLDKGEIQLESDDSIAEARIQAEITNLLSPHGKTHVHSVHVVVQVAKQCSVKITNFGVLRKILQQGWGQILQGALLQEPAHAYNDRVGWFLTQYYVLIEIRAIGRRPMTVGGLRDMTRLKLNDESYLKIQRDKKPEWRIKWEDIERVSLTYIEFPLRDENMQN